MIRYINGDYSYQLINVVETTSGLSVNSLGNHNFIMIDFQHIIATIMGEQIYRDINHKTSLEFDIEDKDQDVIRLIIVELFKWEQPG